MPPCASIHEAEDGKTCVEYYRPSSLFGQFGHERLTGGRRRWTGSWRTLIGDGGLVRRPAPRHDDARPSLGLVAGAD